MYKTKMISFKIAKIIKASILFSIIVAGLPTGLSDGGTINTFLTISLYNSKTMF